MRYIVRLRKGGLHQEYDTNYGSLDAAVFGVLRKESASEMTFEPQGGSQFPLQIEVQRGALSIRSMGKGARRVG